MKNEWETKECFGRQGEGLLYGEESSECLVCELFDKCHKITIAGCLQSIRDDLCLITQNGLTQKKLMGFNQLDELNQKEMKKNRSVKKK
jgi:hypothetical protein